MLVIYEPDCPQHVEVVRQLTRLLQSTCNLDVVSEMTRHEEIRRNKADFVLDSIKQADVVLVVVSENLRAAWLAQRHDNRSTGDSHPPSPSVGGLLLQNLRSEVVHRPRRAKLVAARFDYTPAVTDVDADLALVPEVYELMRDVDQLLLTLRGVKKSTQLLTLDCCLRLAHDNDDDVVEMSKLKESVAVARQHYQQQQVSVISDATETDVSGYQTTEQTRLLTAQHDATLVDNLPSNLTSGYASRLMGDLRSACSPGRVVASMSELAVDGDSAADSYSGSGSSLHGLSEVQCSSSASFESMCWQCVSQINQEYDEKICMPSQLTITHDQYRYNNNRQNDT